MSEQYTAPPDHWLEPSRDGIPDPFQRMVQIMCDAIRRSSGASTCELCDEPCDDPQAVFCARVAIGLGASPGISDTLAAQRPPHA